MKYIAYGSNMVEEQMAVRCPEARLIGTGYISGARLEFYLHATVEETGDQRNRVPVAVWEINQRDEQMLDRYEGYPSYYIKDRWWVHMNDGSVIEGMIYLMKLIRKSPPHTQYYYHRKAFELDRLCNASASMIGCRVVGGVDYQRSSNDIGKMETQANALTPRIQMPMPSFKVAASRRLNEIRAKLGKRDLIDLMEPLIDQLAQDYGVSRLAAKIRLMEAGFTEAIGTFNYVDGHYVRPYSFKSGSLKESQTFTLSAADAGIQWLVNPELRKLTENGDYLFVENHFVFNTKQYVQPREDGELQLTEYARRHMDECCLIFDMKIKSNVDKQYYTECYLNRETSDVTFEIAFHNGYENAPPEKQIQLRKAAVEEAQKIALQMSEDPGKCLKLLLDWRGMKQNELARAIGCNEKTISRIMTGETLDVSFENGILICFALNLPPMISNKLLTVFHCPLNVPRNQNHIWIQEALNVKYEEGIEAARKYLANYGVEI